MGAELGQLLCSLLNQVPVLNILPVRSLPAARSPSRDPLGQAVNRVLGIRINDNVLIEASLDLQDIDGQGNCPELGTVVGLGLIVRHTVTLGPLGMLGEPCGIPRLGSLLSIRRARTVSEDPHYYLDSSHTKVGHHTAHNPVFRLRQARGDSAATP